MNATPQAGYVPIAEVVRNGFVEGVHFGAAVLLDADGTVVASAGDVDAPMLPRSTNKPLQAAGMRELGLRLDGPLLALSAASHWGQSFHLDGVRAILAEGQVAESALQNTPGLPEDPEARRQRDRVGHCSVVDPTWLFGEARGDARDRSPWRLVVGRLPRCRASVAGCVAGVRSVGYGGSDDG